MKRDEIKALAMHQFNSGTVLARQALALGNKPDFTYIEQIETLLGELNHIETFVECFFCKTTLSENKDTFTVLHPQRLEQSKEGIKTALSIHANKEIISCVKCGENIVKFMESKEAEEN